jgi:hypothetical protein
LNRGLMDRLAFSQSQKDAVVIHELGHVAGLGHTTSCRSILAPFMGPLTAPQPHDVFDLVRRYPSRFWPVVAAC